VPVRGDLGVDLIGCQCVKSTPFGADSRFRQPIGQRRSRSDEVLHAHDDDDRFAATSTMKRSLLSTTKSMS
jgi:hypothetical protein